jgi:O-antigen ligase
VNLDNISHRLFQLAFAALALFIPFSIAGANIAIGFGLLAWLLSALSARAGISPAESLQARRPSVLRDPLLPASLLLAVSALPSLFMSEDFTRAFKDWRSYWLLLIFFLVAANVVAHRMREVVFWVLFASTTISCLVAFLQRAGGIDWWFIQLGEKHRIESTLYTMTFAGILYQVIILNFAMALRSPGRSLWTARGTLRSKLRDGWRAVLPWVGLAIQFLAIIMTVTRGAWVALFAGLATVCIIVRNKTALALSAVAVAVVLVFAFVVAEDTGRNISPAKFAQEIDIHARTRLVLWDIAWDLIKQHPLLGVGMGDFSTEAQKLIGERKITTATDSHNVYLQVLATRGLVGFIPFVLFWVMVLRSLFGLKRRSERGSVDWHYAVAAIGVTVAMLFGALTENNIDDEEVFIAYMLILGLALGANYRAGGRERLDTEVNGTDASESTSTDDRP